MHCQVPPTLEGAICLWGSFLHGTSGRQRAFLLLVHSSTPSILSSQADACIINLGSATFPTYYTQTTASHTLLSFALALQNMVEDYVIANPLTSITGHWHPGT
jgi:hypothetical protein